MALVLVQAPTETPISLVEAKDDLKITSGNAEDAIIGRFIRAATIAAENFTRRALISQTWKQTSTTFEGNSDGDIILAKPPVKAVNSVRYYSGGVLTTISTDNYEVDLEEDVGILRPIYGSYWPDYIDNRFGSVSIEFIAGYGTAEDVPEDIRQAIFFLVGYFYANREEGKIPQIFYDMLWPYRFLRFV